MSAELVVDSRGRLCPLPVIDLARAAAQAHAGDVLALLADDPAADGDVPAWCAMRGHEYLGAEPAPDGTATVHRVRLC